MKKKMNGRPSPLWKAGIAMIALTMAATAVVSCEKKVLPSADNDGQTAKVTLRIASIEQVPFESFTSSVTKAGVPVSQACTRINYAIYTGEGEEMVKTQVNQETGEEGFGTISMNVSTGKHWIVVVAHNGDANATMTKFPQVSFNNKETATTTDTFIYCQEVDVVRGTNQYNIDLRRAVTMFKVNMADAEIPSQVRQIKFDISGGSRDVDVQTGYGVTKSTSLSQTFDMVSGQKEYGMFCFVRLDDKTGEPVKLTVKVQAIDEFGNAVKEQTFNEVEVAQNRITRYTGEFFKGGCLEFVSASFPMTVDTDWADANEVTF